MSIRCFLLKPKFVPYLEGGLPQGEAGRLEKHLTGCRACAGLLERVRSGHEAGRRFGRLAPAAGHRPPEFEEVWAAVGGALGGSFRPARAGGAVLRALSSPAAVMTLLALVLTQSVLLVVSNWERIAGPGPGLYGTGKAPELRDFTPISIAGFSANASYRIVTEGFVQSVYFDEEERTLHIRLGEVPAKSEPFVICEVRDFSGMTIPREGSRVRVFGTARFDDQPGRGWHEVNPVMDIALLKR